MAKLKKYDDNVLREVVKQSKSLRECLLKMNLNESGGNFYTLKKRIALAKIDNTHFLGKGWLKGQIPQNAISLEDILSNKIYLKSNSVKEKLLKEGIFTYKCMKENCGLTEWLGEKITLELDHIDGNRKNNNLTNLRLLCPNCHSQTKTWRGRKQAQVV